MKWFKERQLATLHRIMDLLPVMKRVFFPIRNIQSRRTDAPLEHEHSRNMLRTLYTLHADKLSESGQNRRQPSTIPMVLNCALSTISQINNLHDIPVHRLLRKSYPTNDKLADFDSAWTTIHVIIVDGTSLKHAISLIRTNGKWQTCNTAHHCADSVHRKRGPRKSSTYPVPCGPSHADAAACPYLFCFSLSRDFLIFAFVRARSCSLKLCQDQSSRVTHLPDTRQTHVEEHF